MGGPPRQDAQLPYLDTFSKAAELTSFTATAKSIGVDASCREPARANFREGAGQAVVYAQWRARLANGRRA